MISEISEFFSLSICNLAAVIILALVFGVGSEEVEETHEDDPVATLEIYPGVRHGRMQADENSRWTFEMKGFLENVSRAHSE